MRQAVCLLALSFATSHAAVAGAASSRPALRSQLAQMRASIGRIQSLVAKARDDRDPIKLNCAYPVEVAAVAVFNGRVTELRQAQNAEQTPAPEALQAAVRQISGLESSAYNCLRLSDARPGDRSPARTAAQAANPLEVHLPPPAWTFQFP